MQWHEEETALIGVEGDEENRNIGGKRLPAVEAPVPAIPGTCRNCIAAE